MSQRKPQTHTAEESKQAAMQAEPSAAASPMMRLLGRDSGARQSLMQMLPVKDLVSLLRSGRSWREWIEGSPSSVGSQQIGLREHSFASFAKCGWVHRVVHDLRFSDSGGGELAQFMPCLARLPRLRSLHLFSDDNSADEDLLREFFSAVAGTLKHLYVYHCPEDSEGVPALWSALDVLTGLESLTFGTTVHSDHLDFSFLPSMTQLGRFHLGQEKGRWQRRSAEQIEMLSQCKALTDLRCGQFLPSSEWGPRSSEDRQALIDHGLSRLVRRRAENGSASLRHLYLGHDSVIDPMGWRVLSQCTELEAIESSSWSSALSADEWMRLANLSQLHSLYISTLGLSPDPPLNAGHVFAAIGRCRALSSLGLSHVRLSTEHVTVLAGLPRLKRFDGWKLPIESLTPLSTAPALSELRLVKCTGIKGEKINIREMIPPMPLVNKLRIEDQLSEAAAEPLIVALLQRLPRLTRAGLSRW